MQDRSSERPEALLPPPKADWPVSGPGPASGPRGERVNAGDGPEASPLLPLSQSPIPPTATRRGKKAVVARTLGYAGSWNVMGTEAGLAVFKNPDGILPELGATQNVSNYGPGLSRRGWEATEPACWWVTAGLERQAGPPPMGCSLLQGQPQTPLSGVGTRGWDSPGIFKSCILVLWSHSFASAPRGVRGPAEAGG